MFCYRLGGGKQLCIVHRKVGAMVGNNREGQQSQLSCATAPLVVACVALLAFFTLLPNTSIAATKASNSGSVANTRHNLTVSFAPGPFRDLMFSYALNDYEEVCVYCHTPHGSNQAEPNLPLWNHTIPDKTTFTLYDDPSTNRALNQLTQTMTVPGPSSLTCLSCHDGTIAIDSILNMPGSGRSPGPGSLVNNEVAPQNNAFLDAWPHTGGHYPLGPEGATGAVPDTCIWCHSGASPVVPDFRVYVIGKDLSNDHPIGVVYPAALGAAPDFKQPSDTTADGRIKYFEDAVGGSGAPSTNINNHLNTNEIRLYDSGQGFEVECASCHDPHGVPVDGSSPWSGSWSVPGLSRTGVQFTNSFLRISNSDSDLCLTCHDK